MGHHEIPYTDAEAVAAMGAKADDNPLHHDKAEEWGTTEHDAVADGAPHHAEAHDLASHTTKAHAELSDAPEGAHHTKFTTTEHNTIADGAPHHAKYTDVAAKAAAVRSGAITNGETKAPTHDAVFDVKATAEGAIAKTLLTTKGDIITRTTVPVRLGVGADDEVLTADSAQASGVKWAAAGGNGATKEFFVPCTFGSSGVSTDLFYARAMLSSAGQYASISLHIPADFNSITEAVILAWWNGDKANTNLDIYSNYAAVGEVKDMHSQSDTVSTYSFTAYVMREISISGILSSLAAGDYVGISLKLTTDPGGQLYILGVRFKYS